MAEVFDKRKRPRELLAGEFEPQGTLANLADSIMQDSFAGQFIQRLDVMGFEAISPQDTPGYNAFNDNTLPIDLLPQPLLEELSQAGSSREAHSIMEIFDRNTAREVRLQAGGASWSRFLGGFIDPINLIPTPLTVGKGFVGGFKSVLGANAGIITATEAGRVAIDPTDDGSNILINIGAGTLMASALGGVFGHVTRAGVPRVSTPGGRAVQRGQAKLQAGANANDFIDLNQANASGPTVSGMRVNATTFEDLKPYLPEGATLDDFLSGRVHDGIKVEGIRFQGMRHGNERFGDRFFITPITKGLKERHAVLAAAPEGELVLLRIREGQGAGEVVTTGAKSKLVARVESLGVQRVENFSARESIDLGRAKVSDVYKGAPDRNTDPEAWRQFNEANSRADSPRDADGVKLAENNGYFNRSELGRLMDTEEFEVGQTIKELEARITPLEAEVAALEKKVASGKGFHGGLNKKQAIARLEEIKEPLFTLKSRLKVSRETLGEIQQKIKNAEESNNPLDYLIKPTGTKLEDFFGETGKWPFYTLTQTKFVNLAPEIAVKVQRMAYRIAGSPGLAHTGAERGVGIGTSVEMKAKVWFGEFRQAKEAVDAEYAKLAGYGETLSTGEAFVIGQRQKLAKHFKRTAKQLPSDQVSLEEFYNMIGKTMIHGDDASVVLADMPIEVRKAVEAGARHYRKLLKKFEKDAHRLGIFQTASTIRRQIDVLDQKIAFTEEQLRTGVFKTRKGEQQLTRRLMRYELERDRFENAERAFAAGVGDESALSNDFFSRSWDIERIKLDDEGPNAPQLLRKKITRYFQENPRGWVNGRLEEFSKKPEDIARRVDETMAMIKKEAIFDDGNGLRQSEIQAFKDEIQEKLDGTIHRRDVLMGRARAGSPVPRRSQAVQTARNLVDDTEIEPGPIRGGKKADPDEFAEVKLEPVAEVDAIKPETAGTASEEIKRLDRRIRLYQEALRDEKFVGSGQTNSSMSRRINISNADILALDDANPFIDINAERTIYQYTTRMGPAIEMAREFGDRGIFNEMDFLNIEIEGKIAELEAAGKTKDVKAMRLEQDRVNQAVADLRDLVSGTFGTPTDPSSLTARTIRLLMAYNTLTAMGRAVFAAFNDTANIVAMNGVRKTLLGDAPAAFMGRLRGEMSEWSVGKREVEMAGEAFDVFRAARFYQYTDMGGPFYGGTKVERFVHGETGRFFVANLLSVWTDAAERFAGTLAQSRMIEDAIALNAGKLSPKRMQELFRVGMTKDMAKKIVKEWESVPEADRRGKHLFLANTHQWGDELVKREFRAMLVNEINALVPQPGAADKATFMHKDWGRLVFQYKGFSMGATQRIMMANLQRRDKRALTAVVSMVGLSLLIDAMKRPDYIQLDWEDQLYRAVELSGVGGILTDINASLEGATGGEYGIRPMFGLANRERNVNVATQFGAVGGAVANQWSTLFSAFASADADVSDKARAIRYMLPYNNLWIWNGLFNRTQRAAVDVFEE